MRRLSKLLTVGAFGFALAACAFLMTIGMDGFRDTPPLFRGQEQQNRYFFFTLFLIPAVVAALPIIVPTAAARLWTALILGLFVILGIGSLGIFYIPSALVMFVAALCSQQASNETSK